MAGNNLLQILRGTHTSSTDKLLAGQLFYNKTRKYLHIGYKADGTSTNDIGSVIKVRELCGYTADKGTISTGSNNGEYYLRLQDDVFTLKSSGTTPIKIVNDSKVDISTSNAFSVYKGQDSLIFADTFDITSSDVLLTMFGANVTGDNAHNEFYIGTDDYLLVEGTQHLGLFSDNEIKLEADNSISFETPNKTDILASELSIATNKNTITTQSVDLTLQNSGYTDSVKCTIDYGGLSIDQDKKFTVAIPHLNLYSFDIATGYKDSADGNRLYQESTLETQNVAPQIPNAPRSNKFSNIFEQTSNYYRLGNGNLSGTGVTLLASKVDNDFTSSIALVADNSVNWCMPDYSGINDYIGYNVSPGINLYSSFNIQLKATDCLIINTPTILPSSVGTTPGQYIAATVNLGAINYPFNAAYVNDLHADKAYIDADIIFGDKTSSIKNNKTKKAIISKSSAYEFQIDGGSYTSTPLIMNKNGIYFYNNLYKSGIPILSNWSSYYTSVGGEHIMLSEDESKKLQDIGSCTLLIELEFTDLGMHYPYRTILTTRYSNSNTVTYTPLFPLPGLAERDTDEGDIELIDGCLGLNNTWDDKLIQISPFIYYKIDNTSHLAQVSHYGENFDFKLRYKILCD